MITPGEGVIIAGRYTLVRPLARGGMGSVWVARHRDLEIDVTVKFMDPSLVEETEARARFQREAKLAARLTSQHVVQVLDYGMEDGTPYIVMELLKGESLSARLSREGRLAMPAAARLVIQVCKALRTAHDAGLVHRDLKPGNIFLALKDEDEVVKVLDFGIAKALGVNDAKADTESGVLLGSVHYMSPEQIRSSRKVDHRSDLWSVGIILYRMLTGRLPFPGSDVGDVLVRVCTDPFPKPSSIAPDLPPPIDAFFDRALSRGPDQRFQSAMELAEAFSAMALPGSPPAPISSVRSSGPAIPVNKPSVGEALGAEDNMRDPTTLKRASASAEGALAEHAAASTSDERKIRAASEATVKTIPAVQMPDPRSERSPQIEPPSLGDGQIRGRSRRPYLVAAAVVMVSGGIALLLRSTATSSGAPAAPAIAESAALSLAPAPVPSTTTTPDASASAAGRSQVAAASSAAPRGPAPPPRREKPADTAAAAAPALGRGSELIDPWASGASSAATTAPRSKGPPPKDAPRQTSDGAIFNPKTP